MGAIDLLVSVSIAATNATPRIPGFGIQAFAGYHVHTPNLVDSYVDLTSMVTDGFATTEPLYLMAQTAFSQNPAPPLIKIIKLTGTSTQIATFTVTDQDGGGNCLQGTIVGFFFVGTDGVKVNCYYTVPSGGKTTTEVATAIAALTDPTGFAMTSSSAVVTITASAAHTLGFVSGVKLGAWLGGKTSGVLQATPSIATDLAAALAVDTDFYGLACTYQDDYNITAFAAAAESAKLLFAYTTPDTSNLTAASGIGAALKTLAYAYSYGAYSGTPIGYAGLATEALHFTAKPGTDSWCYSQLSGVASDALTVTQTAALDTNRLNYNTSIAGVASTKTGINASGMYADIRRGLDALKAQIQFQICILLLAKGAQLSKIPFDPIGIAQVGGEVSSALAQFTATKSAPAALLRSDPGFAPVVLLPDIANTTASDRGNRILRGITFTCYAQNAVQTVAVTGTVNV